MDFSLDLGSVLGSGIGLLASNASARQQFKYQSALQQQAYNLTQQGYREGPGNVRSGLEKAGYNPMLAVQNGTSGVNASFQTGQASAPDYAGAISQGIANAQSFQRLKNETEQTESINDKNYAEADEAKARKVTLLEHLPWISKREKAEIGNIEKDSIKKEAEIHNIDETTRFIEKEYELRKALGFAGLDVQRYGYDTSYNASTYSANKAYESAKLTANQSGTNTNKQVVSDIAKSLVGAGLAVFVGSKIKLIKPVGDLIKVIPKSILLK